MTAFPERRASGLLGGRVPRQRRIGRQTPLRAHPQGLQWLRGTLTEAARAAARTRDAYLDAQYQRVRARRGANKALVAVAHSLLVAVWHMLQTGETYLDPGGDYFTRRDPPAPPAPRHPARTPRLLRHPREQQVATSERDFLFRDDTQQSCVGLSELDCPPDALHEPARLRLTAQPHRGRGTIRRPPTGRPLSSNHRTMAITAAV